MRGNYCQNFEPKQDRWEGSPYFTSKLRNTHSRIQTYMKTGTMGGLIAVCNVLQATFLYNIHAYDVVCGAH